MSQVQVKASAPINAPAETVYEIIADYRNGHPHILPPQYFSNLEVELGGVGNGTIIRFQMRVLGKTQNFRASITEPEPGRVLVETDLSSGAATTFTVEPVDGGKRAHVTIATHLTGREGAFGLLERFFTTTMLSRIYTQELDRLGAFAAGRASARGADLLPRG